MKNFKIYSPAHSYEKWGGGIGDIYIELGNFAFPDKGWTDFGVDITYWWMESFIELLDEEKKKVRCNFMDGNYRFDLEVSDLVNTWKISLIRERADSEEVKYAEKINAVQAAKSLVETADELLEVVKKKDGEKGLVNYRKRMQDLINKAKIMDEK